MAKYKVRVGSKEFNVEVKEKGEGTYVVNVEGKVVEVKVASTEELGVTEVKEVKPKAVSVEGKVVTAPTPGKVIELKVKPGDTVRENDVVAVLESMKMSIEIYAGYSGKVKEVLVKPGDFVDLGQPMIVIE